MTDTRREHFSLSVLPHLDAAFNLARWLVRDAHDAEDVVQDAMLRALRHFDGFRGSDARPWLLAIVRNASYAWLRARRPGELQEFSVDELDAATAPHAPDLNPETLLIQRAERQMLNAAIAALPITFRETLILRELEDLSYREIAQITEVPLGTVMSRLSRARRLLSQALATLINASEPEATK
nr:sigma-70 family RNA polymerase sigma factor [uncultured Roseateles sp.]